MENMWEYCEIVNQLFTDFEKAYDSERREALYDILTECGVLMKSVRLIKMCLNKSCSKVRIGKYLLDAFPIQNGLKQVDTLLSLLFRTFYQKSSRKRGRTGI
jgi:hypothetical protein